jgi:hypothetical protein
MGDVSTLISRLELLGDGQPLPGDDIAVPGFGTRGRVRTLQAECRMISIGDGNRLPARLACELIDNLPTILAALRYWKTRHD